MAVARLFCGNNASVVIGLYGGSKFDTGCDVCYARLPCCQFAALLKDDGGNGHVISRTADASVQCATSCADIASSSLD